VQDFILFFFVQLEDQCFEFLNLSVNIRSNIHVWAEQHALYHWTVKDDDKSSFIKSSATKCFENVSRIQSEIDSLKLTSSNSNSKLKALELQKQSFIQQISSQEAVEIVNAVLNPSIDVNKLPFSCDECEKSFATWFGLSVHKIVHNKNEK
jgi:hypothetical protein